MRDCCYDAHPTTVAVTQPLSAPGAVEPECDVTPRRYWAGVRTYRDTARVGILLVMAALAAAAPPTSAQSENLLPNGGFEDGDYGWSPWATNATFTIDETEPVHAGSAAAHVTASDAGSISINSQYWWAPIDELGPHTMSIWVHAAAAGISGVSASLEVLDEDGVVLDSKTGIPVAGTGWLEITTMPVAAQVGSAYLRAVVRATAANVGATLHIDSAVVTLAAPEPTATAVPTATAAPRRRRLP